jgi:PhzF family phenazine biosynthesis protein
MEEPKVHVVRVSPAPPDGEDIISVVPDAKGMSNEEMEAVASSQDHTTGFVFPAPAGFDFCHFEIRFWTRHYELERCTHGMIGTVWLLSKLGLTPRDYLHIVTKGGGLMEARITKAPENTDLTVIWDIWVEVSHPTCTFMDVVSARHTDAILSELDISGDEMPRGLQVRNAGINRVKTLLPLKSLEVLNYLDMEYRRAKKLCEKVKSTGLCAYVIVDRELQLYEAREFPRDFGSWEDTATALAFALLLNDCIPNAKSTMRIMQNWGRGRRGEVNLRFWTSWDEVVGCWIGGFAKFETEKKKTEKAMTEEADTW